MSFLTQRVTDGLHICQSIDHLSPWAALNPGHYRALGRGRREEREPGCIDIMWIGKNSDLECRRTPFMA